MKHGDGPRLGAHMSIEGGAANALRRGHSIDCDAIQMFTRNPNRWRAKDLTEEEIADFAQARDETEIQPIVAHSSYLINLGSPDDDLWERSQGALIDELHRCGQLGISDYVLHPGAHKESGGEAGLERVTVALERVLEATAEDRVIILLENTAGAGTVLGQRFEELAWVIDRAGGGERLGVCFDTAHALAAGYEFRQSHTYRIMWAHFRQVIGRERLRCIHLNDAMRDLGSHADRHEQLGKGCVGLGVFRMLVNDADLRHVPMLLETPKGPDMHEDIENLALLRALIARVERER